MKKYIIIIHLSMMCFYLNAQEKLVVIEDLERSGLSYIVLQHENEMSDTVSGAASKIEILDYMILNDKVLYIKKLNNEVVIYSNTRYNGQDDSWRSTYSYIIDDFTPLSYPILGNAMNEVVQYRIINEDEIVQIKGKERTVVDLEELEKRGAMIRPYYKN